MSQWRIRPVQEADYEAVALIRNQVRPEPMTAAELIEVDRASAALAGYQRLVAEAPGGAILAHAWVGDADFLPEGIWQVGVQVERSQRGQGIGEALRRLVEERARKGGARQVEVYLRGEDDAAFEWALKRGYELYRQRTEAVLDVPAFDYGPFAGALERVTQTGLSLYQHAGKLPEPLLQNAYEADKATTLDVPGYGDVTFPTYERWVADLEGQFPRSVWFLALEGDRVVGLTNLVWAGEGEGAQTGMTGVLREYRGRGVALALKLLAIQEAKKRGFTRMRTNNDPDNPPMLAVNRKLGYVFIPGPRRMRKAL